ncbi:helix-turn-helix domain-containing protein [Myroides pelagicus]|uniref:helix-turn-helix domain-containing protein n=1 Tax=Myroides pelagicus TaxID=270914 RepID=UPI002DBB902D|nr:helix-turn-helix domain-containing protein [Myroides pelagicus]MEC4114797.1 helix-turn-helix domain-containing protein [Myroides pelagicus]
MHYRAYLPEVALSDYVHSFWVLEDCVDQSAIRDFIIIPDGVPALIYQETPDLFYDDKGKSMDQFYVYGQFDSYTKQQVQGSFRILGAYLKPIGIKAFFGIDAHEFKNKNIKVEDILSSDVFEKLQAAFLLEHKIAILSQFLLDRLPKDTGVLKKANYACSLITQGHSVVDIQSELGMSERSLERLFRYQVGMSAKMCMRIARFQASLTLLRTGDYKDLTWLAYSSNYYDQSHFIRDFKAFTGTTPRDYKAHSQEQLPNFPEWKK